MQSVESYKLINGVSFNEVLQRFDFRNRRGKNTGRRFQAAFECAERNL